MIHARPVILGTTAWTSPSGTSDTNRPMNRVPSSDSLTKSMFERKLVSSVQGRHASRRARTARRAVEPAGMNHRGIAGVGAIPPGSDKHHVLAAGDVRLDRVARRPLLIDRVHDR